MLLVDFWGREDCWLVGGGVQVVGLLWEKEKQ
jgi:hypothetical protein